MFSVKEALAYAASKDMTPGVKQIDRGAGREYIVLYRNDGLDGIRIDRVHRMRWNIEGHPNMNFANCIVTAVHILLNGDPAR